ncbi:Kiwa anti-phage protein KwaB-like domain-containing protein [Thermithiobacillus plumbiphilus]|uniref:Kiwa anti-phage protein KwaB-like domain-containing protein n=1 Tax=Thermithiobacillus plumbiphilus TaxID=1729899 RepID=A0ABU9D3J5_9PROT
MTNFNEWRQFDYDNATVQLWVFKKSKKPAKFQAWHVRTDAQVESLFRKSANSEVSRITENIAYSHLSQNNENSCLEHSLEESEGLIALLQVVDAPEAENTDASLQQLKGAIGYLVKFQSRGRTVYAVRKTAPTWKPAVRNKMINAIFLNGELSAVPNESFTFDEYFDFYCLNETIFVASKRAYESTVSDKKAYSRSFEELTVDPHFLELFSDVAPLRKYVGQNAIQLRRMTVIQQKALYTVPGFPKKVKDVSDARNWGINFDQNEKIVLCGNTARVVMQVLLDHRLLSEVTENIYDVPDAEAV